MEICLCRVDDRLIHGQITAVWTKHLNISKIFIVDDALVDDRLAVKVLTMAAPHGVEVRILSVEQAQSVLQEHYPELDGVRVMLLFRDLEMAATLLSRGASGVQTLILGGMSSRVGRKEFGKNLFLSEKEQTLLKQIIDRNHVRVISQVLPSDAPADVQTML